MLYKRNNLFVRDLSSQNATKFNLKRLVDSGRIASAMLNTAIERLWEKEGFCKNVDQ